jgi:membrane associated rhomboid family serine protease
MNGLFNSNDFLAWSFSYSDNGFFSSNGFWTWFGQARLLVDLLVIMWIVAIINFSIFPGVLSTIGSLRPRRLIGLIGIPCAPFLHGDWDHLQSNSTAYLILGGMIIYRDVSDFAIVTISTTLISGVITWFVGSGKSYVGASDTIFGYAGFLIALIYFYRDPLATIFFVIILLSFLFGNLLVFPALTGDRGWGFGRMLWGMLPQTDGRIAWETHFFGFVAGVWTASRLDDLHSFFQPIFEWFSNDLIRFIQ